MSLKSDEPAIPNRPSKARNGFAIFDYTTFIFCSPFMKGYASGFEDAKDYLPYRDGLVEWTPDLDPPFIPLLDESFRAGYREGFRDAWFSKYRR